MSALQQVLLSYSAAGGGDGFPLTLPGLLGWWDASDPATTAITAGKVAQWDDKSGAGRHATQDDESLQPTVGELNGLAALIGSGSRMLFPIVDLPNYGYYMFAVARVAAGANSMLVGNSTSGQYGLCLLGDLVYSQMGGIDVSMPALADVAHVFGRVGTPSGNAMHVDETTESKTERGGPMDGFGVYPGGLYLNGPLCEVIVGAEVLSSDQVLDTKAYLKAKWGTP